MLFRKLGQQDAQRTERAARDELNRFIHRFYFERFKDRTDRELTTDCDVCSVSMLAAFLP